jgi:hypothetical protein
MNETWVKEMERAVSYTIEAVDKLVYSDAVNRQSDDVPSTLGYAWEKLTAAIESFETSDSR